MVKDLQGFISRRGSYRIHGMDFPVTVLDVRRVFNRIDFLVAPVSGKGQSWVDAQTVDIQPANQPVRRIEV